MATPPTPPKSVQLEGLSYLRTKISETLGLTSPTELEKIALANTFLELWAAYRDKLPINQANAVKMDGANDDKFIDESATTIYDSMDSMASCQWDEPIDRIRCTLRDYLIWFVYRAARSLARPGEIFGDVFSRNSLKYDKGRKLAKRRICGLLMLTLALVHSYTGVEPCDLVVKIEKARPTANPQHSPIKKVRLKHMLESLDIDKLRKVASDGQDERQWLINTILGKNKIDTAFKIAFGMGAQEASTQKAGQKRKATDDELRITSTKAVKSE